MEGDQIAAIREHSFSVGVLVDLQARQSLGLPLMDEHTQPCG
jgi:hypothetical protein